ncbi:MAG: CopG family transcriptional regulator, partial [Hyphomonas sp.]|nr:CopG family transcriptional regulator [Hyphomonas sp.]
MSKWILGALATALFALAAGFFVSGGLASPANAQTITVYKTPWCGCCTAWIKHLQRDGLE